MKLVTRQIVLITAAAGLAQGLDSSAAIGSLDGVHSALATAKAVRAAVDSVQQASDEVDGRVKVLERLRENDAEEAEAKAKVTPKLQADGSGFWIRSADSAFAFRPRAQVRLGAYWDLDDETKKTLDQFQLQTIRLGFDGTLSKRVDAKVTIDLSKGNVGLQDGYFDLKLVPWLGARFGKFQVPLAWERFVSPTDLLFYDRSFVSQVAPNRDVGAQAFGKLLGGRVEYAVGAFTGGANGSNVNADVNDDKDGYARLWLVPGKSSGNAWIENLGFGVGGSYGYHDQIATSAASYKSPVGGSTFFSWLAADSLQGNGWRIAPQVSWTAGSFSLSGEWIRSVEQVFRGVSVTTSDSVGTGSANKGQLYRTTKTAAYKPVKELGVSAWSAQLSWVVTGEDAALTGGVKPRHAYGKDGWGALEIAVRAHGLTVDDEAFHNADYADSTKSARSALSYGASAVWHLFKGTRLQLGYERTQYEEGGVVDPAAKVKVVRDRKPESQLYLIASTGF